VGVCWRSGSSWCRTASDGYQRSSRPISNLKQKLGIAEDERVIGYIGSFNPYEGLDLLLEACIRLVQKGEKLKLLLVGDSQPLIGASATDMANTGLKEPPPWLIQVGRVPHEQVADYYALLDAVVIPRKPLAVCQLVPPMKAAEALAYGKRLVVSDVAPLAEYAQKHEGVVAFEAGSAAGLATALQGSLKLPAPQPSKELLFSKHTEQMVRVLKGVGGATAQEAVTESQAKAGKAVPAAPAAKSIPVEQHQQTSQPSALINHLLLSQGGCQQK
ncbi:MAG: glycosyltransferase family 4 protein, partial [Chromatiales bacterium]|nr:glycosyltransferase family 4 protein [Chromatiales bacterium]